VPRRGRDEAFESVALRPVIVQSVRSAPRSEVSRVRPQDTGREAMHSRGVDRNPRLSAIRQIAITVSDVERALAFYRDVLGLEFLFRPAPDSAFLDAGGIRLMLSTPQGAGEAGRNSILYFEVSDIGSDHASLVEGGATNERGPARTATMPDHELRTVLLRDPDGNLVGLLEEKRKGRVRLRPRATARFWSSSRLDDPQCEEVCRDGLFRGVVDGEPCEPPPWLRLRLDCDR
jgi:catechol 2,3-dioxygenase-like lactoylglutathione lyase family enzyme